MCSGHVSNHQTFYAKGLYNLCCDISIDEENKVTKDEKAGVIVDGD